MAMKKTGNDRPRLETGNRVAFDLTPAMVQEVNRILAVTDLDSRPDVFRRAFTLLRIHVEAALSGREIYMTDPNRPSDRYLITLPFAVAKSESGREE